MVVHLFLNNNKALDFLPINSIKNGGITIERFNRTMRYELLNQTLFESLEHAQIEATNWLWCYNNNRPHMSLGGFTPVQTRMMTLANSRVLH